MQRRVGEGGQPVGVATKNAQSTGFQYRIMSEVYGIDAQLIVGLELLDPQGRPLHNVVEGRQPQQSPQGQPSELSSWLL